MRFGLICGSGELPWQVDWRVAGSAETPFGTASMAPEAGTLAGVEVVKVARHGSPHRFAPHAINYRANLHVLKSLGVECVVAINTVGGISDVAATESLLIPDQLIDYSWGRPQTFSADDAVRHIDFTEPYTPALRERLLAAAPAAGCLVVAGGVMGVTQGPRLETAAEISRMAADGCSVVGMTGMPEAVLARELDLDFASICLVVNPAAGLDGADAVDMEAIREISARGMQAVGRLLLDVFEGLQGDG